jgi:hypothetical protein
MNQDPPPGRRLGPYAYLSIVLQCFISGEGIVPYDMFSNMEHVR